MKLVTAAPHPPLSVSPRDGVTAVQFRLDGLTVTTSSDDGTVRLWDALTGKPLAPARTLAGGSHTELSPDGQRVLTIGKDGKAWLWDAASGRVLGTPLEHHGADQQLRKDRDRTPDSPQEQMSIKSGDFSPNGRLLLTFAESTMRLWDAATGRPIGPTYSNVNRALFSPDGHTLLVTRDTGQSAVLRDFTSGDLSSGRPIALPLEGDLHYRRTFSPDGRVIRTGDRETMSLWDSTTGRPLGPRSRHEGCPFDLAISRDGRTVVSSDRSGKSLRLWDITEWPDEWASAATLRIEAMTCMTLDKQDEIRYLDKTEWGERLERLASRGVPLSQRPRWSLDPILYGRHPCARAKPGWNAVAGRRLKPLLRRPWQPGPRTVS